MILEVRHHLVDDHTRHVEPLGQVVDVPARLAGREALADQVHDREREALRNAPVIGMSECPERRCSGCWT
jgi:hypothetical protein